MGAKEIGKVEAQMKAFEAAICPVCGRQCRNQFNLEIHKRVQGHGVLP